MNLLHALLARIIRRGVLTVRYADGTVGRYGAPDPAIPPIDVTLADAAAAREIARRPGLGSAETFMDGRLAIAGDDIMGLLWLFSSNVPREAQARAFEGNGLLRRVRRARARLDRFDWERRSRRNVAHHYDLDDRLYDLFLDADRQYSCGYFARGDETLDEAQRAKQAHIAAKLDLRPGQRVLDIGCGWGGLALYLARAADVQVLGITLSEEQLKVARARAKAAGLGERVRFELMDYRHLEGRFDRIVSVGMFEHIGPPHYRTFFARCRALLADDGVMLLHTIGRIGEPGVTDAFTRKYIFPGGHNPAMSEIVAASEPSGLILTDVETWRLHYAETLERWYARVFAARDAIEALYDARFFRMWTYYLAGAACGFRNGDLVNYQLQYARRRDTLPITRDYMRAAEIALLDRA